MNRLVFATPAAYCVKTHFAEGLAILIDEGVDISVKITLFITAGVDRTCEFTFFEYAGEANSTECLQLLSRIRKDRARNKKKDWKSAVRMYEELRSAAYNNGVQKYGIARLISGVDELSLIEGTE